MKRRYRFRSAETGRYVTAEYAAKNPKTTIKESIPRCAKPK